MLIHLHPNPKVPPCQWCDFVWCADRKLILVAFLWCCSAFESEFKVQQILSDCERLVMFLWCTCVLTDVVFSDHSLGSIKSLGVCCPLPRTLPLLCTGWGSSPLTMSSPSPASGTSCPSWGRWRRPLERQSTVAWWVSVHERFRYTRGQNTQVPDPVTIQLPVSLILPGADVRIYPTHRWEAVLTSSHVNLNCTIHTSHRKNFKYKTLKLYFKDKRDKWMNSD